MNITKQLLKLLLDKQLINQEEYNQAIKLIL